MSTLPNNPTYKEFLEWVRTNPRDGDPSPVDDEPIIEETCWQRRPTDDAELYQWINWMHADPAHRLPEWMRPADFDPHYQPPVELEDCSCRCEHRCGCLCGGCAASYSLAASLVPTPPLHLSSNTASIQTSSRNGPCLGSSSYPQDNGINQNPPLPRQEVIKKVQATQARNQRKTAQTTKYNHEPDRVRLSIEVNEMGREIVGVKDSGFDHEKDNDCVGASTDLAPSSHEQGVGVVLVGNAVGPLSVPRQLLPAGQNEHYDEDEALARQLAEEDAQQNLRPSRRFNNNFNTQTSLEELQRRTLAQFQGNKRSRLTKQQKASSKKSSKSCRPYKRSRMDSDDEDPGPSSSSQAYKKAKRSTATTSTPAAHASSFRQAKRSRSNVINEELDSDSFPRDSKKMKAEVDPEAKQAQRQASHGGEKGRTIISSTGRANFEEAEIQVSPSSKQRDEPMATTERGPLHQVDGDASEWSKPTWVQFDGTLKYEEDLDLDIYDISDEEFERQRNGYCRGGPSHRATTTNSQAMYSSSQTRVSQAQLSPPRPLEVAPSMAPVSRGQQAQCSNTDAASSSVVQKKRGSNVNLETDTVSEKKEPRPQPKTDLAPKKNDAKTKPKNDTAPKKKKNGPWTDEEYHMLFRGLKARRDLEDANEDEPKLADVAFWTTVLDQLYAEGLSRQRSNNAARFFWSRRGRARSGFDERLNKSGNLVTCAQDKKKTDNQAPKRKRKNKEEGVSVQNSTTTKVEDGDVDEGQGDYPKVGDA